MSLTGQGKDEHRVCHCVTGWKECWTSLFLIHQLPSSYICGGCICLLLFLVVFPLDFSNSSLLSSFWGSEISSSKSYLHIWSFQLLEYQWSEGEFGTPGWWAEPNYPSVINKPAATWPDASDKFMTEATSMHLVDVVPYILKFIFSQRNRTEIPIFNQSLALCLSASGPFYFDRLKSFS